MRLFVEENYATGSTRFFVKETQGNNDAFFHMEGKTLICETIERTVTPHEIKPLIEMPYQMASDFIKCLADYANEKGIKTEKRDFIEGELIATKRHLEDLRKAHDALLATIKP